MLTKFLRHRLLAFTWMASVCGNWCSCSYRFPYAPAASHRPFYVSPPFPSYGPYGSGSSGSSGRGSYFSGSPYGGGSFGGSGGSSYSGGSFYGAPLAPALSHAPSPAPAPVYAPELEAYVELRPAANSGVSGILRMQQSFPGGSVKISGKIRGLKPGKHGFHVHMTGDLRDDCKAAGGHFNPFNKQHGDPYTLDRHVGDLGNIVTFSPHYPTQVFILDRLITLEKDSATSVLNRAVVVHAGEDDLGRGGDEESKKTGNAGARVACGIIRKV